MTAPTIDRLKELLSYDPESGDLIWRYHVSKRKEWNTRYSGKIAFTSNSGTGYKVGSVDGKKLYAHRVAWAIHYQSWPDIIDHVNGDRSDNRISNLRSVSATENARNCCLSKTNRSGVHGVIWWPQYKKWRATITVDRQHIHIGLFKSLDDAIAARFQAGKDAGFHQNHGRAS